MKIGLCADWKAAELRKYKELGFDCYETALTLMQKATEEELAESAAVSRELDIPNVAFNGMFPAGIQLMAGESGHGAIRDYLEEVLPKAKKLGGRIIVLGSGNQRMIPEGVSKEEATERFVRMLREVVAPEAEKYGFVVALEELRPEECNFMSTIREAEELAEQVNSPYIGLHFDNFHAFLGGADWKEIEGYGKKILHVHLSSMVNLRHYPDDRDLEDLIKMRETLEKIGYGGAVTFEGIVEGERFGVYGTALRAVRKAGF